MLIKVSQHIYALPQQEEKDRPYLYYIYGKNSSLAVDAGSSPAHVKEFYQALRQEGLPLPQRTVLTHWHWDHSFGLCAVQGETWATEKTNAQLQKVQKWKWMPEDMARREESGEDTAFCHHYIRLEYPELSEIQVVPAKRAIHEEEVCDLGEVHCRLLLRDTPHSRDALLVLVPEDRALLVGDASGVDFYDYHASYDPERLKNWIHWLEGLDFSLFLSGHRPPQSKQQELEWLGKKLAALPAENDVGESPEAEDSDLKEFREYLHNGRKGMLPLSFMILLIVLGFTAALLLSPDFLQWVLGLLGVA